MSDNKEMDAFQMLRMLATCLGMLEEMHSCPRERCHACQGSLGQVIAVLKEFLPLD